MKRALYSLDDEEFLTLLERTDDVLRSRNLPHMFVGGVATQAHIVNYLCQKEGRTLYELTHSHDFRIQDHLRATDDADITLDVRRISEDTGDVKIPSEVIETLKEIEGDGLYHSPGGDHLISIKLERTGAKRPVFRLGIDKEASDSPNSEVSLNFYYGPNDTNHRWSQDMVDFERANYFDFFNTSSDIVIPYSQDKKITLKVKGVEQLLATKIARAREKDWSDILLLYRHASESGNPINLEDVEQLLSSKDSKYQVQNENLLNRFDKFKYLIK